MILESWLDKLERQAECNYKALVRVRKLIVDLQSHPEYSALATVMLANFDKIIVEEGLDPIVT